MPASAEIQMLFVSTTPYSVIVIITFHLLFCVERLQIFFLMHLFVALVTLHAFGSAHESWESFVTSQMTRRIPLHDFWTSMNFQIQHSPGQVCSINKPLILLFSGPLKGKLHQSYQECFMCL